MLDMMGIDPTSKSTQVTLANLLEVLTFFGETHPKLLSKITPQVPTSDPLIDLKYMRHLLIDTG